MAADRSTPFNVRVWNALGALTLPRHLYHGPRWWRSLNAWWLGWWGAVFFHTDPWKPFTRHYRFEYVLRSGRVVRLPRLTPWWLWRMLPSDRRMLRDVV